MLMSEDQLFPSIGLYVENTTRSHQHLAPVLAEPRVHIGETRHVSRQRGGRLDEGHEAIYEAFYRPLIDDKGLMTAISTPGQSAYALDDQRKRRRGWHDAHRRARRL